VQGDVIKIVDSHCIVHSFTAKAIQFWFYGDLKSRYLG